MDILKQKCSWLFLSIEEQLLIAAATARNMDDLYYQGSRVLQKWKLRSGLGDVIQGVLHIIPFVFFFRMEYLAVLMGYYFIYLCIETIVLCVGSLFSSKWKPEWHQEEDKYTYTRSHSSLRQVVLATSMLLFNDGGMLHDPTVVCGSIIIGSILFAHIIPVPRYYGKDVMIQLERAIRLERTKSLEAFKHLEKKTTDLITATREQMDKLEPLFEEECENFVKDDIVNTFASLGSRLNMLRRLEFHTYNKVREVDEFFDEQLKVLTRQDVYSILSDAKQFLADSESQAELQEARLTKLTHDFLKICVNVEAVTAVLPQPKESYADERLSEAIGRVSQIIG